MNIISYLIGKAARPKVIHSIPGRLRIKVPFLKQIPADYRHIARQVTGIVGILEGVEKVKISFVSSSMVINYDENRVGEDDVLEFLAEMAAMVGKYWDRFTALDINELPIVIDRIENHVSSQMTNSGRIVRELELPDDIWN